MAEPVYVDNPEEYLEFTECGSLSINYDATGKVTVGLTVLKNDNQPLRYTYTDKSWGEVDFDLIVMSAAQQPILGTSWVQWSLQMDGVGN